MQAVALPEDTVNICDLGYSETYEAAAVLIASSCDRGGPRVLRKFPKGTELAGHEVGTWSKVYALASTLPRPHIASPPGLTWKTSVIFHCMNSLT